MFDPGRTPHQSTPTPDPPQTGRQRARTRRALMPDALNVCDAHSGMRPIPTIHRDQVGSEGLNLPGVAQPPSVDTPHPRNQAGECLNGIGRLPVVTQDEDIRVNAINALVEEQHCRDVMEGGDNSGVGKQCRGLLRCGTFRHG